AIALYEKSGYARIEDFGYYKGYPDVRSYGRELI
ncbi:MAG TPA: GNAT family N-acetyltransferase, partial [Micromonosporaceae bacterium]